MICYWNAVLTSATMEELQLTFSPKATAVSLKICISMHFERSWHSKESRAAIRTGRLSCFECPKHNMAYYGIIWPCFRSSMGWGQEFQVPMGCSLVSWKPDCGQSRWFRLGKLSLLKSNAASALCVSGHSPSLRSGIQGDWSVVLVET